MPPHPDLPAGPSPDPDAFPDRLTDDQMGRLAAMIADGRCEFPDELSPADRDRLRRDVKRRLRDRLIRHVARAVALHLLRAGGLSPEK